MYKYVYNVPPERFSKIPLYLLMKPFELIWGQFYFKRNGVAVDSYLLLYRAGCRYSATYLSRKLDRYKT